MSRHKHIAQLYQRSSELRTFPISLRNASAKPTPVSNFVHLMANKTPHTTQNDAICSQLTSAIFAVFQPKHA
jgi:hypothetical protein